MQLVIIRDHVYCYKTQSFLLLTPWHQTRWDHLCRLFLHSNLPVLPPSPYRKVWPGPDWGFRRRDPPKLQQRRLPLKENHFMRSHYNAEVTSTMLDQAQLWAWDKQVHFKVSITNPSLTSVANSNNCSIICDFYKLGK